MGLSERYDAHCDCIGNSDFVVQWRCVGVAVLRCNDGPGKEAGVLEISLCRQ